MTPSPPTNPPFAVSATERTRLLRLAFRMCWNQHDAEDVLHDALLAATRHGDRLRDPARRGAWLRHIVVQHCRLHWRRQRLRHRQGPVEIAAASAESADEPEQLGMLMRDLLVYLPDKQRIAVTLRHIEQFEYGEIARIMGVAGSTARAHVRAGRETLRRLIVARHPEWRT